MDITKTIIRITQDYCFKNGATLLSNEFSLYIATAISPMVVSKSLTVGSFVKIATKRKDFFAGNSLDLNKFCKGLFDALNYELPFIDDLSLFASIKEYKRKFENGIYKGFPLNKTLEDALRGTLQLYIKQETFSEPRSGAGNNDITIPSEKVVVETKIWKGLEYYKSGIVELYNYLLSYDYSEGYYVVYDYNKNKNEVIKQNGEVFDTMYMNKNIHVFFIKMSNISPSKIYSESKRKNN